MTLSEHRLLSIPDRKLHGANMGPIWDRQDPGGPHVGPMNFAIWDHIAIAYGHTKAYSTYIKLSEIWINVNNVQ